MTDTRAPWAERLAESLKASFDEGTPDDVLERAAIHTFDTLGCAAGANDSKLFRSVLEAVRGSGPGEATIWFGGTRAAAGDSVLVNGTSVRYLDANDVILGKGPGGHPSDNIPVALAAGEIGGSTGREVLSAIALSYDMVARIRSLVFRKSVHGPDWHEVSISGVVSAAVFALLVGADRRQLASAISLGASSGYTLKEVRRGEISDAKAAANATVARNGVLAANLALNGLSGPPRAFEGRSGLLATLGLEPSESVIKGLTEPPSWVIRSTTIKAYPAFGTAQSAIAAAVQVSADLADAPPSRIESITIRLPDVSWTREYVTLEERRSPTTRGTADHSMQFLVAVSLLDGTIGQHHYEAERWLDDDVRSLMRVTEVVSDPGLDQYTPRAFPAAVDVKLAGGGLVSREVLKPPGSPEAPFGWDDVAEKFARIERAGLGAERINAVRVGAQELAEAPDLENLIAAVAKSALKTRRHMNGDT